MSSPPHPDPVPDESTCAVCGARLMAGRLDEQCPRCLLELAADLGPPDDELQAADLLDYLQVRSFGDYELLEEIARGGMGVVYRARQVSLSREVAVKMILAGELAGRDERTMFRREALAAAQLHHPNIVPVYEIGEHETQNYFTMRLVPGGWTIADWAASRRQAFPELADAVARAARAVAHAHARGVLHRDLKPSNILWDAVSGPQVTDFGLAKLVGQSDGTLSRSILAQGSPCYMAPEQIAGPPDQISIATDVYGLGAVLYELLTGRPPFSGNSVAETMRRVAEEMPTPLPSVPRDLRTICLKSLSKQPKDRYESSIALAADLERFSRGEPVSAVPLTSLQTAWRWMLRRPKIAALVGLCLAILLIGLVATTWQWLKTEAARAAQVQALERARQANAAQAAALRHLEWQEIGRWTTEGQQSRALAYLASLIRAQPDSWGATMYAMSLVEQNSFSRPVDPEIRPPSPLVGKACLAPDGSWLAAAGKDGFVRVWDAATGQETARFHDSAAIVALAVSDGPVMLAHAAAGGAVTLRRSAVEPPLRAARATTAEVRELRFTADGSRLLARCRDAVEVWRADQPDQQPQVFRLDEGIRGVEIDRGGGRLLAWGLKHAVVWELASGVAILDVHAEQRFESGSLAANGGRVALIDNIFFSRIWDLDLGEELPRIESPIISMKGVALDAAGTRVTSWGSGNDLAVHDIPSTLSVSPLMHHGYVVDGMSISADGSRTASWSIDKTMRLWDARTGESVVSPILWGLQADFVSLSQSRDGRRVLLHLSQGPEAAPTLGVWSSWHRRAPQRIHIEGQRDFTGAALSPDNRLGALGLHPGRRAFVYDLATGKPVLDEVTAGEVYILLFSEDVRKLYALTANGWLYGWSLETGRPLWPPNRQPGMVRPAALSPDGTRIIAGHNDGHIRIYDTATGELLRTLDHPGEVKVLRFAPDGSGTFLSASTDRLAHLWDLKTGRQLMTFQGHQDTILCGGWSPDSRFVSTGSYDFTARVWDAKTGQPVSAPLVHLGTVAHLEFSPDGTRLATACRDGTARLWHPLTGEPASRPMQQVSTSLTVRFTADGKALVLRDHAGFRFWETETGEPVTVHYPEPLSGGLGMDSANWRSMISPDGTRVFLGFSVNHGVLWSIPQPRGRAPDWLPSFLEALSQMKLDDHGQPRILSRAEMLASIAPVAALPAGEPYADWARQVLGLDPP